MIKTTNQSFLERIKTSLSKANTTDETRLKLCSLFGIAVQLHHPNTNLLMFDGKLDGKRFCFDPNKPYLAYPCFVELLLGLQPIGYSSTYSLEILSHYLKGVSKDSPESITSQRYSVVSPIEQQLQSALQTALLPENEYPQKTEEILKQLNSNIPVLLTCRYMTDEWQFHAIGLKMNPVGDDIDFEIYNSGYGLETFHEHNPETSKYQTMLRIRIPKTKINYGIIESILTNNFGHEKKLSSFYRSIMQLGTVIHPHETEAVWQSPQKKGNCSLEWIFAYLKNSMKNPLYRQIRIQLFKDCIENIQRAPFLSEENKAHYIEILNKKIKKREKRNEQVLINLR